MARVTHRYVRAMHRNGYCMHGVYVGGCGADYMCGQCEDGDTIRSMNDRMLRRQPRWDMIIDGRRILLNSVNETIAFRNIALKNGFDGQLSVAKYVYDETRGWIIWAVYDYSA